MLQGTVAQVSDVTQGRLVEIYLRSNKELDLH